MAVIKSAFVLLSVLLINSAGFAGHSVAMTAMSHEIGGMSHNSSNSNTCVSLCRTPVVNKEVNIIINDEDEDDDEPLIPFYLQNQQFLQFDNRTLAQHLYAIATKPPPKVPAYILYSVFRA